MTYNLTDLNTVKNLLSRHGFTFSKALGQNFITDPTVCPKMAELAGIDKNTCVIEVGPGVGVLTVELAKRAKKVVSLELDARLLPILSKTLDEYQNVYVVNADVLKTDLREIVKEYFGENEKVCVCANLPYYITSPVIMYLLESGIPFESLTLMVQKEAGDRLTAEIGTRDAGALTYAVRFYSEAALLFSVGKNAFTPPPKVNSCVIKLTLRKTPPVKVADEAFFFRTVRAAFLHRRKTAVNGLSSELSVSKEKIVAALSECRLSPTVRAEQISMETMAALSDRLYEIQRDTL